MVACVDAVRFEHNNRIFDFVTECLNIAMFVHLKACHATTHSSFTWPRPVL